MGQWDQIFAALSKLGIFMYLRVRLCSLSVSQERPFHEAKEGVVQYIFEPITHQPKQSSIFELHMSFWGISRLLITASSSIRWTDFRDPGSCHVSQFMISCPTRLSSGCVDCEPYHLLLWRSMQLLHERSLPLSDSVSDILRGAKSTAVSSFGSPKGCRQGPPKNCRLRLCLIGHSFSFHVHVTLCIPRPSCNRPLTCSLSWSSCIHRSLRLDECLKDTHKQWIQFPVLNYNRDELFHQIKQLVLIPSLEAVYPTCSASVTIFSNNSERT